MFKLWRGFLSITLCAIILVLSLFPLPAAAAGGIRVFMDGQEIGFEVPPFVEAGRTLVPLRAIMEGLGAFVAWDGNGGRIKVTDGNLTLTLQKGSNLALIDGRPVSLEVPLRIVQGRTFVPLRFLSENLGYSVVWVGESKTVYLYPATATPAVQPVTGAPAVPAAGTTGENIYGISLGDSAGRVRSLLGEPQRVDRSTYGIDWWIYNADLLNYLQVGVRQGIVTALYTCGLEWSFAGISPGDPWSRLAQQFKLENNLQLTYDGAIFTIRQTDRDLRENPLVMVNDAAAIFYCDLHEGDKVVAVFLAQKETLLKRGGFSYSYRYDPRRPPDLTVPFLSAAQRREAAMGAALQLLDLANSMRLRRGLPLLAWHPQAAAVAREHSQEMYTFGYFAHESPLSGKNPFDRLRAAGIVFLSAGENIAYGQPEAFCAHAGLMNSLGHRQNILNEGFTHLGAGVVDVYYTQKFLTPHSSRQTVVLNQVN